MAIRLIAADMDDTLLDPSGALSPRTTAALREAMRRGVRFVLASGRMPFAMRRCAEELGVNAPIIAFNGALTLDLATGRADPYYPVSADLVREAARMAEERGGHVQAYRDGAYFFKEANRYSDSYGASIGLEGQALGVPVSEGFAGPADKLLVIHEPENIARWAEEFRVRFQGRLRCFTSRRNYLEITSPDAAKENALRGLSAALGIAPEDCAAFGDGENDLGMVRFAGHGYIMANAREDVRAQAPRLAPANSEDGVAQIVEQWLSDGSI